MGAASWGQCTPLPSPLPLGCPSPQAAGTLPLPLLCLWRCLPAQAALQLLCTPSAYLSIRPEFITLQRLYKMCLVIVCFFLISANCIFRERGPEPQREERKKTPRKRIAAVRGEGGELAAQRGCAPGVQPTWVHLVGQAVGVGGLCLFQR